MNIAILGGGISGVALARLCAADGHDVTVLEKSERAGGLCKSRRVGDFVFDEAGGHIMFSKDKGVLGWMQDRCEPHGGVVETVRKTRIRWHDRWVPYPFENGIGHLTTEAKVECLDGYIESYVQRRLGTECPTNFGDWIDWRMGAGFAKHFMVPYNEKIWECDLRRMSSGWVAGRVPEAPIRDIVAAAVGETTEGYTHQSVFWFPARGGFETMVRGTVDGGGFDLRTGVPVEKVEKQNDHWMVNGEPYDLVVNTVPLPIVEPHVLGIPEEVRADIRALKPISLANVLIGLELDEPLPDLSWIYLPFEEQGPANRVTYYSNYSPNNAPPGHASLMAEVTYRGKFDQPDGWRENLCDRLRDAGVLHGNVVALDHVLSEYAYIDQDLEFADRIARVRSWFDGSGIITFGRFGRYEYHNSDQCIARAMEVHGHIREIAETGDPARPSFA